MRQKVDKILAYGGNVFINRQLIYDYPEQLLCQKGQLVIEHADFQGIERIGAALGAQIVSTFDSPERGEQVLGHCDLIEQIMIGEDKVIRFSGCRRNEACTIVLRGASKHILDEAERSLHDALCVLIQTVKNRRVVFGGGNCEIRISAELEKLAKRIEGKEALAIEAYARALRQIPIILADNGGFDSAQLVQNLRVAIEKGQNDSGLNLTTGCVDSMEKQGVYECFRSKESSLLAASEAAELIMRVDEIVTCPPRPRREPKLH